MPSAALAATGWKPEWKPVALLCNETGWHGLSKADCVTVWLPASNWNCTIWPTVALILSGWKTRAFDELDTRTTMTSVDWAVGC